MAFDLSKAQSNKFVVKFFENWVSKESMIPGIEPAQKRKKKERKTLCVEKIGLFLNILDFHFSICDDSQPY